jgi:hypothetical protein
LVKFLRWSRTFHRWLAYGLGVIVALWVFTGVVMVIAPTPTTRPIPPRPLDPTAATRSVAEAAEALPNRDAPVRTVTLRDLGGRVIYDFVLRNNSHVLVDAVTAQRIELTDSLARALARRAVIDTSVAMSLTQLTKHDARYASGPLPAYRVALSDDAGTLIHVTADGSLNATTRFSRFRAMMGQLHEFQLRRRVPEKPRRFSLQLSGILTIVLVLTGYVLTLPVRRRKSEIA